MGPLASTAGPRTAARRAAPGSDGEDEELGETDALAAMHERRLARLDDAGEIQPGALLAAKAQADALPELTFDGDDQRGRRPKREDAAQRLRAAGHAGTFNGRPSPIAAAVGHGP